MKRLKNHGLYHSECITRRKRQINCALKAIPVNVFYNLFSETFGLVFIEYFCVTNIKSRYIYILYIYKLKNL